MNFHDSNEEIRPAGQKKEPDSLIGFIKSLPPLLIIVELIIISVFIYFFLFF